MADIQKFLDKSGVSTLWTQVANKITTEVTAEKTRAEAAEKTLTDNLTAEVTRAKAAEKANADALALLNSGSTVEGSVAYQIAQIVAGAGTSFDTLKEIADWIGTHTSDVTTMNSNIKTNSDDIAALEALVGDTAVATQIAEAIAAQDLSKYALASNLTALQEAYNTFTGKGVRPITQTEIDKLAKLVLTDGELSVSGSVDAGSVVGLSDAVDARIANQVVALTTAEIKEACGITE